MYVSFEFLGDSSFSSSIMLFRVPVQQSLVVDNRLGAIPIRCFHLHCFYALPHCVRLCGLVSAATMFERERTGHVRGCDIAQKAVVHVATC